MRNLAFTSLNMVGFGAWQRLKNISKLTSNVEGIRRLQRMCFLTGQSSSARLERESDHSNTPRKVLPKMFHLKSPYQYWRTQSKAWHCCRWPHGHTVNVAGLRKGKTLSIGSRELTHRRRKCLGRKRGHVWPKPHGICRIAMPSQPPRCAEFFFCKIQTQRCVLRIRK